MSYIWVTWVRAYYVKGSSVSDVMLKASDSWNWKKLLQIIDQLRGKVADSGALCKAIMAYASGDQFGISKAYQFLCDQQRNVAWAPIVWESVVMPRHSFCAWLAVKGRLLTADRLGKIARIMLFLLLVCCCC